jgi:uncharacterized protein (UPF0276 family)
VEVAAVAESPVAGLGLGLGWRPEIAGVLDRLPGQRFTEVVAESLPVHGPLPVGLAGLRERGVTAVPHGTRLSLGGTEPLDPHRVAHLARAAEALDAPLLSEHIAFVRAGGLEAGHLLPLPRTREALDVLSRNIGLVQAEVGVPLAVEPIAALFDWPEDEYTEADFVRELLERTGAWLLLDVANVYANARNRHVGPWATLDRLPLERVAYLHVAGGAEHGGVYHDTHTAGTPAPVLELLRELSPKLAGARPALLLERDGHYPPAAVLRAELDAVARAGGVPEITGVSRVGVTG